MRTAKDVAEAANVSVPTVYKVFDTSYSTSPEIRSRVLSAAQKIGYVYKATRLVTARRKGLIGFIMVETFTSNNFYGIISRRIADQLEMSGYHLHIVYTRQGNAEKEAFEILREQHADGIIYLPADSAPVSYIQELINIQFPLLQLLKPVYDGVDTLLVDDALGTYKAVTQLLQYGHRRIMMLLKNNNFSNTNRIIGYNLAFTDMGLVPDGQMLCGFPFEENVKEMMKEKIKSLHPTALISVSEGCSANTIRSLRELSLRYPEDISFIAYDDFPWISALDITAVGHSISNISNIVAKILLRRIENRRQGFVDEQSKLMVDPHLISRNSVRPIQNQ